MKIDELLAAITPADGDDVEEDDFGVDEEIEHELALCLLHECGELLDRLTDKQDRRLSRTEQGEISKLADEVYELLQGTDVDYGDALVKERE